ncbi:hypothetical protein [Roseovarius nanhaiticus]|uniref:hypothetical protein n=1 Tax=Roseovarius nanhaiticus TaxID=573024 RepID=UPI002493AF64|nr:hypothetical protein [Roseovarius nanhaiticus]
MRRFFLIALLALCACKEETKADGAIALPRPEAAPLAYWEPAEWQRTGDELLPLDNIGAQLAPIWREVSSCGEVAYQSPGGSDAFEIRLLYIYDRAAQRFANLACDMESHGYYVSHVARVKKDVWSDYEMAVQPRHFTFLRIQSADGLADFMLYHVAGYHPGSESPQVGGCNRDEGYCWLDYYPGYVTNLSNGLYTRFKIARTDRNDHIEDSGAVALLLGKDMPEVAAFVGGATDGIPRALAQRALVREVQRQYPEGLGEALDLYGYTRPMTNGVVIEDVGANFGLAGTDASYLITTIGEPVCEPTENEAVRQCKLIVETSLFAYNRATGSRQTKFAQIANVAASGNQRGEIEALFVRGEDGWRMIITDQIARFLSGVDRKNDWVVVTSDGRTLSGAPAVSCIADPSLC